MSTFRSHDPRVRRFRSLPGLVLGAVGAAGCSTLAPDRAVVLSSDPPGAYVIVDGRDSGFSTPCKLDLDTGEDRRIDFELPGFRTETRLLTADHEVYALLWHEMNVHERAWRFPLFLNFGDFLVPVKWTNTHSPGRVHVVLDRLSDEPSPGPATRLRTGSGR